MTFRRRVSGVTLLELMIALGLSVFLLGALSVTYFSARNASTDNEALSRLQENIRFAGDHLVRDLRNAAFRDQLTLTFEEYRTIGEHYADINDDGSLTIRYAGRYTCPAAGEDASPFSELQVVEKRYFVDEAGFLACESRAGRSTEAGFSWGPKTTARLAAGLAGIEFELLPVGATLPCTLEGPSLDNACTGVDITATFRGVEDDDLRDMALTASFRNVIVERIYRGR
jgi:type II secretory pathway component PulJ